jgi:hypothetical protein
LPFSTHECGGGSDEDYGNGSEEHDLEVRIKSLLTLTLVAGFRSKFDTVELMVCSGEYLVYTKGCEHL